ncbi:hypothetical protein MC885_007171 [Smutsia gigantea]|nr:hypothetical protein MC885_007171 [Smutsia gigantea]
MFWMATWALDREVSKDTSARSFIHCTPFVIFLQEEKNLRSSSLLTPAPWPPVFTAWRFWPIPVSRFQFKPNLISWLEQEELKTVETGDLQEWEVQLNTKDSEIQGISGEKPSSGIEQTQHQKGITSLNLEEGPSVVRSE